MMVARDGVERFGGLCNQQVADCIMDTKDTEDSKDISCVRSVCAFSVRHTVADLPQRKCLDDLLLLPQQSARNAIAFATRITR